MFDISCGEDTAPGTGPSCGMFGTEPPKSEGKGLPEMTLEELLQRLDLVESKPGSTPPGSRTFRRSRD